MERKYPGWADIKRRRNGSVTEELARWLVDLVESVLTTPIGCGGGWGVLGSLAATETLREVRFDEATPFSQRRRFAPLMTGSIDLLFRFEGKYYVLDWKTNWLEDYSQVALAAEMDKHNYPLQAAIYGAAVRRWLVSRGDPLPSSAGPLYLFVRAFARGVCRGTVGCGCGQQRGAASCVCPLTNWLRPPGPTGWTGRPGHDGYEIRMGCRAV